MKVLNLFLILFVLLPTATFAQNAQAMQSKIVTDTIYSKVLKAHRPYTVYLPKSFDQDKNRKYPVLYLLHGMWGHNKTWADDGHLQETIDRLIACNEACEMIIVTPHAGGNPNISQNGYFDMPGWNYESFFYDEFLPYIENKYRVIGDKGHRAVAGFSMGGGGATSYGQRYSNMFCAVYAMSALMSIPEHDLRKEHAPDDKFGILTKSVIENDCIKYVSAADNARKEQLCNVQWFVDCGDDDFLLDRNIEFYQAMRSANIPCQFRVKDGAHDWEYWRVSLHNCLPFVSRIFWQNK